MTVPAYLPAYVLAGSIVMIASLLIGLARALAEANWPAQERRAALRGASVILIGWFAASLALGSAGFYQGVLDQAPTIQYGIFIPILLGAALIWRSPYVARLLDAVPQSWIVGVQLYRALGVIFLILMASDRMPGLFAWPAGVGDMAVGLAAPLVALLYARDPKGHTGTVAAWNILGIADLAIAVGTGFLTSPSPLQIWSFDAPNDLISVFPLVMIPVFLVPVSVVLHLASLAKLRRAGGVSSRLGSPQITA